MVEQFDPYITFRVGLSILFSGFVIYDIIALMVWFRGLPRLMRRMVLLKLLQVRSHSLKLELALVAVLLMVQGILFQILVRGV